MAKADGTRMELVSFGSRTERIGLGIAECACAVPQDHASFLLVLQLLSPFLAALPRVRPSPPFASCADTTADKPNRCSLIPDPRTLRGPALGFEFEGVLLVRPRGESNVGSKVFVTWLRGMRVIFMGGGELLKVGDVFFIISDPPLSHGHFLLLRKKSKKYKIISLKL